MFFTENKKSVVRFILLFHVFICFIDLTIIRRIYDLMMIFFLLRNNIVLSKLVF